MSILDEFTIKRYTVEGYNLTFKTKKQAESFIEILGLSKDKISTTFEPKNTSYVEFFAEFFKREKLEEKERLEKLKKENPFKVKYAKLNKDDDDYHWLYITADDYKLHTDEVRKLLEDNYNISSILSYVKQLSAGKSVLINKIGGYNTFEPFDYKVIDDPYELKPQTTFEKNKISGWLAPDGKFYYASFYNHGNVLDKLLKNKKYKDYKDDGYSFVYFSSYKSRITGDDDSAAWFEEGIVTDKVKESLDKLRPFMTDTQEIYLADYFRKRDKENNSNSH